jgi:hypothetical protein
MKIKVSALTAILASSLWMSLASASIIFTPGNHPQPDEANILFGSSETGTTITGEVDHSGVAAVFSSLTGQTLFQNAKGQADIHNLGGGNLTSMSFTLESGFGFLDYILNLQSGIGDATVTVHTEGSTFTYALGSGQNFLTIVATGGDVLTGIDVTMSAGGGFEDFKQPRISGVCEFVTGTTTCTTVPMPEPGVLSLLGIAMLGVLGIRRLKR